MSKHFNPMAGSDDDDESPGADFQVCEVVQERELAIEVMLTETQDTLWVPKSVIHDDSEVFDMEHAEGTLVVHEWWAVKEGLL